jgi:hypothetical protein
MCAGIAMKRMNGWKRLFVVIAICWAPIAFFLAVDAIQSPAVRVLEMCDRVALRKDDARSRVELDKCSDDFERNFIPLPRILGAMIGMGDRTHGLLAWGVILIPLCLLWVLGKIVGWVAAGFRH